MGRFVGLTVQEILGRDPCMVCGSCQEHSACLDCGLVTHVGDWPSCPHSPINPRRAQGFDPIVVHVDSAGNFSFPANSSAVVPEGYEKKEIRNFREYEQFRHVVEKQEYAKAAALYEGEERCFGPILGERRRELRSDMERMSNYGRDFARLAIKINNERSKKKFQAGFHVQAMEYDASNREPWNDPSNPDWKRDRKY